jgi:thiopurine S-methyltransferase
MEKNFWQERWEKGAIGFHKGEANDLLQAHHDVIARRQRVYVPLCGKSLDLVWLRDAGHDVVGSEFVGDAIGAFFAEQLPDVAVHRSTFRPAARPEASMTFHEGAGVRIVEGDALVVDTFATGGKVDAVWDRAALVALDPATREAYRDALLNVLSDDGVVLLVTFSYDQEKLPGPPWSVSDDDVMAIFGAAFDVERVSHREETPGPKFVEAGITALSESAFVLRRRSKT